MRHSCVPWNPPGPTREPATPALPLPLGHHSGCRVKSTLINGNNQHYWIFMKTSNKKELLLSISYYEITDAHSVKLEEHGTVETAPQAHGQLTCTFKDCAAACKPVPASWTCKEGTRVRSNYGPRIQAALIRDLRAATKCAIELGLGLLRGLSADKIALPVSPTEKVPPELSRGAPYTKLAHQDASLLADISLAFTDTEI